MGRVTKEQRQHAIAELVRLHEVADQASLIKLLREHHHMSLSQATVSIDLKEMGIRKKTLPGRMNSIYQLPAAVDPTDVATQYAGVVAPTAGYRSYTLSGNLIVVHTAPGFAHPIAATIDQLASPLIAGTIAGYDTIFIVIAEGVDHRDAIDLLHAVIPETRLY